MLSLKERLFSRRCILCPFRDWEEKENDIIFAFAESVSVCFNLHSVESIPVGICCQIDVVLTSMRLNDVASTLIRRHFYVISQLG